MFWCYACTLLVVGVQTVDWHHEQEKDPDLCRVLLLIERGVKLSDRQCR